MSQTQTFKNILNQKYTVLKGRVATAPASREVAELFIEMSSFALKFLSKECRRVDLISKVPGKTYFAFCRVGGKAIPSRPANVRLFDPNVAEEYGYFLDGTLNRLSLERREQLLYTLVMSYCCTSDLLNEKDQKTPGTFFECFISHLLSKAFGVAPKTQIEVLHLEDESSTLPTDFIFDLGNSRPKFHVPVKTSTRERIIQVFAHQKVLDGVHGVGTYKGILIGLAETKLGRANNEVVEICVPAQWRLYQRFIAQMHRFYYFDVPKKYEALSSDGQPRMNVSSIAKFFDETDALKMGG